MKRIYELLGVPILLFLVSSIAYGQCEYTFRTEDSFGDGWDGSEMEVIQDGITVLTITGPAGAGIQDFNVALTPDVEFSLEWTVNGGFTGEKRIDILDENDNIIYSMPYGSGGLAGTTLFTGIPCPACPAPTNLAAEFDGPNSVALSWESPANSVGTTIEWATADFTPGNAEEEGSQSSSDEEDIVSGLTVGETYYFYVQSDCGATDGTSVWTGPVIYVAPDEGDQCETAIEVASLPYTTTDDTDNYSDYYNGSPGTAGCGTTSSYLTGNDVVYAYTADYSGLLNVSLTPVSTWSGIFVYEDCSEIGVKCVAGEASSSSIEREFDMNVVNGVTYYFVISTNAAPQTTEYTFTLTNCIQPSDEEVTNVGPISADLTWSENGSASEWQVIWGLENFDPEVPAEVIGDENVTGTPAFTFDDLDPETTYDYYVRAICGASSESSWLGPNSFTTTALCAAPFDIEVNNITDDGVLISWNAAATNESWDIEWQAGTFTQGTGANLDTDVPNPLPVTGLTPETEYFFYLKANCADGEESAWVGPLSFTTQPTCLAPSDLIAFNFTGTSAQISWVENGDATSWGVIYGETGFDPETEGSTQMSTDTTEIITGLTEGDEYEFYVYADCGAGDASDTIGPVVKAAGYCEPASTSTLDNIEDFVTTGALLDINHTGQTQPAGPPLGYGDFTDTYTLSVEPGANVDVNIEFSWTNSATGVWVDWNNNFDFEPSELIFSDQSGASISGQLVIPDDVVTGEYRMRVRVYDQGFIPDPCNSHTWGSSHDYKLQVVGCGSAPVAGVSVAATGTTAMVTWNASLETNWNLEYGPEGFTLGTGTEVTGLTANEYEITGLDPNTEYDVYVQGFCDAVQITDWNDATTFTTAISTLPFTETFEETSTTVDGWMNEEVAGTAEWTYAEGSSGGLITTAFEGDLNARFVSQAGNGTPVARLISPVFDLSAETEVELSFYYGQQAWGSDQNELKVYYRTGVAEPWVEVAHYTENISDWTLASVLLDDLSDNMQIAFEGINNFGRANVVDNVRLSTCARPTDVMASNVAATTADISWTENGAATEFTIEYGPVGFAAGTGTTIPNVTANPYELTGLTQETEYEVRVQADCGAEQSLWSDGEVFETTLSCPVVTDVVVTNLTPSSFDIAWTAGDAETEWNIEIIETGNAPGSGTSDVVNTPSYSFTGLDQQTDYTVIISGICDNVLGVVSPDVTEDVTTPATCPAPSVLVVSNITATTVDLNWTNNGSSNDFIIEYEESGFTPGTGTEVNVTNSTSTTITGLDPETEYTFIVYADCGGEVSDPATPRTRTTLPSCLAVTDLEVVNTTAFTVDLEWTNNNPSDDFIVEYGEEGFTLGDGETVTVSGASATIEDLDAETTYDFYVYADCGGGDVSDVSDVVTGTTLEACPAPTGVNVTDVTQTSAQVNWTAGGNEVEWTLEYGPAGFVQGEGEIVDGITDTEYLIEGLDNSTEYDVYLTGNCPNDDNSDDVSVSFTTELGCGGVFVDNGGANGNYSNNSNDVWTICPESTDEYVKVTFTEFNTESSFDGLYVFDGDDITAPQIASANGAGFGPLTQPGAYWGTTIPGPFEASQTNTTGCLTFQFLSDGSATRSGWEANIECVNCEPEKPEDTVLNVCRAQDSLDLFDVVGLDSTEQFGTWSMPGNETLLDGSVVTFGFIPAGEYTAIYTVNTPCVDDTTIVTLNIFPPSSAGDNGTIEVCRNEPLNLFDGLLGNIDLGGTWFAPNGDELEGSLVTSSNIPGSYNYDYSVSNGVCPADSQFVEVIVGQCDYLSVDDEKLGVISVYPNPASDVINITNDSELDQLSVEILDMNGRLVYASDNAFENGNTATISVADFDKGVYTIRVHNFEGQRIFKVVKH